MGEIMILYGYLETNVIKPKSSFPGFINGNGQSNSNMKDNIVYNL